MSWCSWSSFADTGAKERGPNLGAYLTKPSKGLAWWTVGVGVRVVPVNRPRPSCHSQEGDLATIQAGADVRRDRGRHDERCKYHLPFRANDHISAPRSQNPQRVVWNQCLKAHNLTRSKWTTKASGLKLHPDQRIKVTCRPHWGFIVWISALPGISRKRQVGTSGDRKNEKVSCYLVRGRCYLVIKSKSETA